MSEEYDDDFDEMDEMDDMGFEEPDNEEPEDGRSAIVSTFKGASSSFIDDFKDTNKAKQAGDIADAAFKAAAGKHVAKNYEALKGTFTKELSKSTREIKSAAQPFVSKLKDTLPEDSAVGELLGKLDSFLGSKNTHTEESEEARIARESNELVMSVFGEQAKRSVLDSTVTALANKNRDDLLRQITAIGQTSLDFHNSNTLGYYKKSIELKYKHLFETKRTFKLQLKSFETFKRQFETIVKNTALPDFVKIRGMEAAHQQIRQRALGTAYESAMNMSWVDNAKRNITNRFRSTTEGIVDGLTAGTEGLDMMEDMGDQFADPTMRNMVLGGMGADGARGALGRIGGKIFSKTKRGKKFKDWISKVNADPGTYFGKMQENTTGMKSWLAGSAANLVSLNDDYVPYRDMLKEDADTATYFDNRTKTSITTVIPSLLSKIYGSVESIRTGNDPDGMRFDHEKNTFISNSASKAMMVDRIHDVASKEHSSAIEGIVKTLAYGANIELTERQQYRLGARLTSFGIRDKNITLNNLEEKGFFKGLDFKEEMLYRSIFANLGKDNEGNFDWAVLDNVNKELGRAINIRSNPEGLIKKMIDEGFTEDLIDMKILKWDRVKHKYVIDMVQYDKYSLRGINKELFKEHREKDTYETDNDKIRTFVRDGIVKGKKDFISKIEKQMDKLIDPLLDYIAKIEEDYDDPETNSKLRSAKNMLNAVKKEALKGDDVNKSTDKIKKVVKDVENMLKGQLDAVKKGKKSKFKAFVDSGKSVFSKIKKSGIGSAIKDDAANIAGRAKGAVNVADEHLKKDFNIDIGAFALEKLTYLQTTLENLIIKRYLIDPDKDKEALKAVRRIINENIRDLDSEDMVAILKDRSKITDIYDNIIEKIEEEGIKFSGVDTKTAKDDIKAAKKAAEDKIKDFSKKVNDEIKDTTGFDIEAKGLELLDNIKDTIVKSIVKRYNIDVKSNKKAIGECYEIAEAEFKVWRKEPKGRTPVDLYNDISNKITAAMNDKKINFKGLDKEAINKDTNTLFDKAVSGKDYIKGLFTKDKDSKDKDSWISKLTGAINNLAKPKTPKFGIFDKDKDGDRDGGFLDRMNFFKKSKSKEKTKDSKKEKDTNKRGPLGMILSILTGALGVGGTLFTKTLGGIFSTLAGVPKALGLLTSGFSSIKGVLGVLSSVVGFGFSSIMGLMKLGRGVWRGAGKLDKIVAPKLRKLLTPKKLLIGAGLGLAADFFSSDIKKAANKAWEGLTDYEEEGYTSIPGDDIPVANDPNFKPPSDTTEQALAMIPAGYAAKAVYDKIKPGIPTSKKIGEKAAAKLGGKVLGKVIPGVAAVTFGSEAYDRYQAGNYVGAAASSAAAALSVMFPFAGGIAGEALSLATEEDNSIEAKDANGTVKPKKPPTGALLRPLLDRIAKGETGTTDAKMYATSIGFGKYNKGFKPIHTMTIAEIYEMQTVMVKRGAPSSAVGRYQFIHKTLKDVADGLKLDIHTTVFSPEIQDMLIIYRLKKTRKLVKWLKGEINDDAFIFELSKEFASIACPFNTTRRGSKGEIIKIKRGTSYYQQGVHTTLNDLYAVLNSIKGKGGAVVSGEVSKQGEGVKGPKVPPIAQGILDAVKGIFKLLGIETKDTEDLGDGTPTYDDATIGYGSTVSKINGNNITGTKDSEDQLGGIPYKFVSMPNIAKHIIEPKYLLIHNTAGATLSLDKMKSKGIGTAVWIDTNGEVIVVNKLNNRTWHVGPISNLKGGASQPVRSSNTIGIEMVCAYNKKEKKWNRYTEKQKASLRKVAAFIMAKFHIPLDNVKAHIEVAYKTKGEGMEGVAVIRGVGLAPEETPKPVADIKATTIPDVSIPHYRVNEEDLGDGTPTYDNLSPEAKKKAMARRKKNTADIDARITEDAKPLDMKAFLHDIDISLGKAVAGPMRDMTKELKENNRHQKAISENTAKGNNVEVTIKDSKGKEIPKVPIAPNRVEFHRAG